jgi:hypothetical protein
MNHVPCPNTSTNNTATNPASISASDEIARIFSGTPHHFVHLNESPSPFSDASTLLPGPSPPSSSGRSSPALSDPQMIRSVLTRGTRMTKIPNKASSRPEERVIKVDLYPLQMTWESKKKKSALSTGEYSKHQSLMRVNDFRHS